MKTKAVVLIVCMFIMALNTYGVNDTLYTINTTPYQNCSFCIDGDSLVIIAPVIGTFYPPSWSGLPDFEDVNQITILKSAADSGEWVFMAPYPYALNIMIHFFSNMTPRWNGMDTTHCGTSLLLLPQPDLFASCSWSNGATTPAITLNQSDTGWFVVQATNACNTIWDSIHVVPNPNTPNLGINQILCSGSNTLLDAGSGYTNYLWSNGITTQTNIVSSTNNYSVTVTDGTGCVLVDYVQITFLEPTAEAICYVEFDSLTLKNNINWTANLPNNADSVNIYKETSLGVWTLLGTVHKSVDHFIDNGSVPNAQSYSYKIAVIDTCGNESVLSSHHTTITLLSTYDSGTNTYGFSWSPYYGLTVSDYYLYGINSGGVATLIGSVPGNQFMFNYVNPSPLFNRYFVAFQTPSCSSKTNVLVKSNWVLSVLNDINELTNQSLKVYPNPAQDIVRIEGALGGTLRLLDIAGRLVLEQVNNDGYINISTLAKGSYILELHGEKGIVKTKLFKE